MESWLKVAFSGDGRGRGLLPAEVNNLVVMEVVDDFI